MAQKSPIEWTESTWNPVTGCTRISPGCKHCYAERMAKRLQAMGQPNYVDGFEVRVHPEVFSKPLQWRKPRTVFVNSMSDLFHEAISEGDIQALFEVMRSAHWHVFQILTKRSERLAELSKRLDWPPNVWMGVTVESKDYRCRIDDLRRTPAHVKFISFEPLLGAIPKVDLPNIDWIIVGGESGPGARPMEHEWVAELREQALVAHVPFFFKQWGGVRKKRNGRTLDGRTWDEMPSAASDFRV